MEDASLLLIYMLLSLILDKNVCQKGRRKTIIQYTDHILLLYSQLEASLKGSTPIESHLNERLTEALLCEVGGLQTHPPIAP